MFKPRRFVQILVQQFTCSFGLPFEKILPQAVIEETLKEEKVKYRQRLYSPIVTLWAFLSQVLDKDKTCHNAVSRIISWLAAQGEKIPSEVLSGYCQARVLCCENFVKKLLKKTGKNLEKEVKKEKLWCGRHVKVFDGSSGSMPDTKKNQEDYPQPSSQKQGCGREGGILSYLCDSKLFCGDIPPLPAVS